MNTISLTKEDGRKNRITVLIYSLILIITIILITAPMVLPIWYDKPAVPPSAPQGMPDFDQNQLAGGAWHCAPTSAANSLWWMDDLLETTGYSFEDSTNVKTSDLVTSYVPPKSDDDVDNVPPLITDLAQKAKTNQEDRLNEKGESTSDGTAENGTYEDSLRDGINDYSDSKGLGPKTHPNQNWWLEATRVVNPNLNYLDKQLRRSQDIILLLGAYDGTGKNRKRVGGHYITLAGIDKDNKKIKSSDPWNDTGNFPASGGDRTEHNNTNIVSHDVWDVTVQKNGRLAVPNYGFDLDDDGTPDKAFDTNVPEDGTADIKGDWEIETAIVVCPTRGIPKKPLPKIIDPPIKKPGPEGHITYLVTGSVTDESTLPQNILVAPTVASGPGPYASFTMSGPFIPNQDALYSWGNVIDISNVIGPDSSGNWSFEFTVYDQSKPAKIEVWFVDNDGESSSLIVTHQIPIGYNTFWLIFTAIFLMLAGGYLIFRKRKKFAQTRTGVNKD